MRNIGIAPTATIVALALAGCGSRAQIQTITSQTTASTTTAVQEPALQVSGHATQHKAKRKRAATGLAVSNASNDTVQSQPSPGSCHARGSGLYSLPDPNCTPGALNPVVTQVTIDQTICVTGWTKTVRPSADITQQEKAASMAAYGVGGPMSDYEYDHLVSLAIASEPHTAELLFKRRGDLGGGRGSV